MKFPSNSIAALVVSLCVLSACSPGPQDSAEPALHGTLKLSLGRTAGGVTAVAYTIACADGFNTSTVVSLEPYTFPSPENLALDGRTFSDLFVVAPAGPCTVNVQAMRNPTTPAENCAPVTQETNVAPRTTQEETLIIHCTPFEPSIQECTDANVSPSEVNVTVDPPAPYETCSPIIFTIDVVDPDNTSHTLEALNITAPEYDDGLLDITIEGNTITVITPRKGFLQVGGLARDCPASGLEFGSVVEVTGGDDLDTCL